MSQTDSSFGQARQNVSSTSISTRHVHTPETHDDVVDLVRQANVDGIPLYPISTGFNWGYGSSSPVVPGCALVDMRKMKKILNADSGELISASNPVAVIEPGVTQGDLYSFLDRRKEPLTFNVTGSSKDTSIIGNCLDRGVGYFGPRREDLFALGIVLGNGKTIYTGFRRLENSPLAYSHPYGLGPMLDGLFFQGNFGIVTSGCFRLAPRRPKEVAISLALHENASLGGFIDILMQLKREGLVTSVTHIGNKARSQASLHYGIAKYLEDNCSYLPEAAKMEADSALQIVAPNEWTSLAAVTGTKSQVTAAIREIRKRIAKVARLLVVTDRLLDIAFNSFHSLRFIHKCRMQAAMLSSIKPFHKLALGVPTDAAIDNLMWRYHRNGEPAVNLDKSNCGLLYISPALPPNGKLVENFLRGLNAIAKDFSKELYITINVETASSLVAVINLLFDRSSETETASAHQCAEALFKQIHASGLEVYRARTDMMKDIVDMSTDYWQTIASLKRELDPKNIIAPGRYNLASM
jgi:4-cresol dehydrogenase (hydroxylating)